VGTESCRRASSVIQFGTGTSGPHVEMWYNRDFTLGEFTEDEDWRGAYTGLFHPDISCRIQSQAGPPHWLHFDAKYKLDRDKWQRLMERSRSEVKPDEREGLYERGDLYTMHAYRDAILGSRGSYVLYPGPVGAGGAYFVRQPTVAYRDRFRVPSVGAFPLVPTGAGVGSSQEVELEIFLEAVLADVSGTAGYCEEAGLNLRRAPRTRPGKRSKARAAMTIGLPIAEVFRNQLLPGRTRMPDDTRGEMLAIPTKCFWRSSCCIARRRGRWYRCMSVSCSCTRPCTMQLTPTNQHCLHC